MRLRRAYARHNALANTGQHGIFAGAAHQLVDVGAHCHTGLGYELYTILGHSGYRRGIYYLGVYTHLHGLEHIAACEVDCGSHLKRQRYIGL